MRKYLPYAAMVIVLIVGCVYLYQHRDDLYVLRKIGVWELAQIFSFTLLFFYTTGYTFSRILKLMDVRLNQAEIFGLSILTNFGNYLGPIRPGAAFKAVYLKKYRGVRYSDFASLFAANGFISLFMMGVVGLLLLAFAGGENLQTPMHLYYICTGIILVALLPLFIKLPKLEGRHKVISILQSAIEGFDQIRRNKTGLAIVCLTFIAQFVVAAMINMAVYHSIGVGIGMQLAMAIGVFTSIANLFTITPNNLGVQEAVIAYIFTLSGSDFSTGLIGASLARIVHMFITFSLAPIFTRYLVR